MRTAVKISKGMEIMDALGDTDIALCKGEITVTLTRTSSIPAVDAKQLREMGWVDDDRMDYPYKFTFKHKDY